MSESTPASKQTFKGHCHCGRVAFEFQHKPLNEAKASRCNCSICNDRGYVILNCEEKELSFTKGSLDDLTEYMLPRKAVAHYFCPVCGSGIACKGITYQPGEWGVNLRCVEGIDWEKLAYQDLDGKNQW